MTKEIKQVHPKKNLKVHGDKLYDLRVKLGLTQREVEKKIGIPFGRLTHYERGHADIPPDHLEKLLTFYKVSGPAVLTKESVAKLQEDTAQMSRILGEPTPELAAV